MSGPAARRWRLLAALLPAVALLGCGASKGPTTSTASLSAAATTLPAFSTSVSRARTEVRGLAEHGLVLGNPTAPVEIIEYASLACATCARIHRTVVPAVIDRYVRTGVASLELRAVVDSGRSRELALGAYAASAQARGWEFVQLVYLRAGPAGGTPSEPAVRLAASLGLDPGRWRADRGRPEWRLELRAALSVLSVAGFHGDPVFLIRRPGQAFHVLVEPRSIRAFETAVADARRAHA